MNFCCKTACSATTRIVYHDQIRQIMLSAFVTVVLLLSMSDSTGALSFGPNIQFRNGQSRDGLKIASTMAKELMNPLGIQTDRFVVAVDAASQNNNSPIGWAQIRPLEKETSAQRDPKRFNAPPGSYDLEQDVDDAMLDEFENDDSIQVPVGLASLPWTKEYREMEEAVQNRSKRREEIRSELKKQADASQLYELSSVYVEPAYRGQGIGTELVNRVLKRKISAGRESCVPSNIYLLTLATTAKWYQENFGFEVVENSNDIPKQMAFEMAAGSLITKIIGAQLTCMRGTSKTSN